MSQGWIKIHRKIKESWIWDDKPYDRTHAWFDLLLRANHQDKKIMLGNELIEVKRGSFITSELKLCEAWGWSKTKLRSFLKMLQVDNMIKISADKKKTTVNIVNYSIYQDSENHEKTTEKPQENHKETIKKPQKNTNKNEKNKKNEKNLNNDKEDNIKQQIDEVWNYYLSKISLLGIERRKTQSKVKHIRARLADMFTVEQLKKVMDLVFSNPWMMGENPDNKQYIEIENFLSNTEKVEKRLLKIKTNTGNTKSPAPYNNKSSTFNNFEQRDYDFEDLERKLLGWDKPDDEQ